MNACGRVAGVDGCLIPTTPFMGSTSTKHRQIAPGSSRLQGVVGLEPVVYRRIPAAPQLEIHGRRLSPKAKTAIGHDNGLVVKDNTLITAMPANSRPQVNKKTPAHNRHQQAVSVKATTVTRGGKLGGPVVDTRYQSADNAVLPPGREANNRKQILQRNCSKETLMEPERCVNRTSDVC